MIFISLATGNLVVSLFYLLSSTSTKSSFNAVSERMLSDMPGRLSRLVELLGFQVFIIYMCYNYLHKLYIDVL